MKKYLIIPVLLLFFLSACTFLFPAETNITIAKIDHPDDGNLILYLRHVNEGYYVTVNGVVYDCVMVDDTLKCSGPSLQPGEKAVIRFYEDDTSTKPFYSLEFDVPEYDEGGEDPNGEDPSGSDDLCPDDPKKTAPGACGCGVADIDTDGDGTLDCNDKCPKNPDMTSPGENGCKAPEKDSDNDGIPDSEDKCSEDPEKNDPGVCGCGSPDIDTDGDGLLDCEDECIDSFSDPIGDPCDHDEDNDGEHDFADGCPLDPNKTAIGYCGCGYPETDSDKDGTPDCADKCPDDSDKIKPGACGCGESETDSDKDGIPDCIDVCKNDPIHDSVGDPCNHNEDGDKCLDWEDEYPYDCLKPLSCKICS